MDGTCDTEVLLYDTTLRDGTQQEGISLSVMDKLRVVERLDEFGVDYIEGGWPGSNAKDAEFFARAAILPLRNARLVAFGSTRHKAATPASDANLAALLDSGAPVLTLVGKACAYQVRVVLGAAAEDNLAMISSSVAHLKAAGREVLLDAEHFFDGYKADPAYALACVAAAASAGADAVVLCDTNGGCTPWEVGAMTAAVAAAFPGLRLGIHCHNDCGMAVANSVAAVRALSGTASGCVVQGTINGYGERTGNANLTTIIPVLGLKLGVPLRVTMGALTSVSRFVDEVANVPHVGGAPFVGASAFAHKGGIHVAAVLKDADTYQHVDPAVVGNATRVLVSELSGRGNLLSKARELGLLAPTASAADVDAWGARARRVLGQVKALEHAGCTFEAAEASVELMLRRTADGYRSPFVLLDFSVLTGFRTSSGGDGGGGGAAGGADTVTRATIKLELLGGDAGDGDGCPLCVCLEVGEGNGPVDAVNAALQRALRGAYSVLDGVVLSDYKVRILDAERATAATTRVMVEMSDGPRSWTTVGGPPEYYCGERAGAPRRL
eukprot:TRINITY_DN3256_c0_g1_i3.p1 TRINITY_DN3256_c0_g1~~TRINITY_DN3256_c0_g1_i3.p1  ORF type:complete len:617 (-),score=265.37 TRINITY_DN3256_c0_g1_i3:388-2049(-)